MDKTIQVQNICTGNFGKYGSLIHYDWDGFYWISGIAYLIIVFTIILMVSVKIGCYQMDKIDQSPTLLPKTKDLESNLSNFTFLQGVSKGSPEAVKRIQN